MSNYLGPGILVVDDQPENRLLMVEYLGDLGLPIDEADGGKKCLELLHQKKYTIVIMDIQMPEMNGFEVLEIMRKDEELMEIPVVFVSTIYDSEQYIVKGISEGAIDFIPKPVNVNILKSKVSNYIKLYDKQTKLDQAVKNLEIVNKRLKANERKIKGITTSASDSIILLDPNYKIIFWNKASYEIFGYSKYEILSENFFENLIDKKSQDILTEKINYLLKSSNNTLGNSIRLTGLKKSGIEFPIELSLSYFIAEGTLINYTIIIRDIAHNIKMEKEALRAKELRETNKMMREFINNVSHELRTPMNAILGISNMMLKYNSENLRPKQIEGLQIINQSGTRLLDMINDVLDLAKLESGKVTIVKEEVDLEKLLATIRSMVISLIDKKDIKFIILKSPQVPAIITSDNKKLNQILLNLLSNAVKFTQKGKIHLFIHHKEGKLIFEVTDTGIGISEENKLMIFERFSQIDNSESKEYKGTGLGLHITKSYVELLGGQITVESGQEKGTTMRFFIPFEETNLNPALPEDRIAKKAKVQLENEIDYNLPLAIIIDDNEQNTFWYTGLLKDYGYSVISYSDSSSGFMAIKQYLPDLILLKLEMPKMHGQFIIDQIGNIELLKSTHFLIITSVERLTLQNIVNSYKIINEPFTAHDLEKQLDILNIIYTTRQNTDLLYLYEEHNHSREILKINHCFQSLSLNSAKLIVARRKIKELVLDGYHDLGYHSNIIRWLSENPEVVPEKIIVIIGIQKDNDPAKFNKIKTQLPEELKSIIELLSIEEVKGRFR